MVIFKEMAQPPPSAQSDYMAGQRDVITPASRRGGIDTIGGNGSNGSGNGSGGSGLAERAAAPSVPPLLQSRETGDVVPNERSKAVASPFAKSWVHFVAGGYVRRRACLSLSPFLLCPCFYLFLRNARFTIKLPYTLFALFC